MSWFSVLNWRCFLPLKMYQQILCSTTLIFYHSYAHSRTYLARKWITTLNPGGYWKLLILSRAYAAACGLRYFTYALPTCSSHTTLLHSTATPKPPKANSASYPQQDGKRLPASVVTRCGWGLKAGMIHSTCGWTCGWQASEWVSSFLTAHQHIIGYSVPEMVDSNRKSM